MPHITVRSAEDRVNRELKIGPILIQDQMASEPTRLRIPLDIYDRSNRSYVRVPEAAWNIEISGLEAAGVDEFIRQLGMAISAVAKAQGTPDAPVDEVKP